MAEAPEDLSQETKDELSLASSVDFFTNPRNYVAFDLTSKGLLRVIACVDPRNEKRTGRVKTAVQTAGGAVGEGHDRALALTVVRRKLVTVQAGLEEEIAVRGSTVLGAHNNCKFILAMLSVLAEEAEPSDFTKHDLRRSLERYNLREDIAPVVPKVRNAAKRQIQEGQIGTEGELLAVVDKKYPAQANVAEMIGENTSRIYVTNHSPHVGLNRDIKAKLREEGDDIQGYHESRRAAYDDILISYDHLTREDRRYRIGAFFLRSAAARTVLGRLRPNTLFFELTHAKHGLMVVEQNETP